MEYPDEQSPPDSEASSPQEKGEKRRRPRRWKFSVTGIGRNGMLLLFGGLLLILIYAFVHRIFLAPPVEPEVVVDGKQHVIQLDVLNGSGVPKLAQRFTDYLRARGFDVVEMGNYRESDVSITLVLDRSGNLQAAEQVADALGIPRERVRQQIDRNAYLDVSVIIGKDFRSLKPLL
jgi:hypothetical protein